MSILNTVFVLLLLPNLTVMIVMSPNPCGDYIFVGIDRNAVFSQELQVIDDVIRMQHVFGLVHQNTTEQATYIRRSDTGSVIGWIIC